ncbi:MAG: S49 family peptidase, partial [Bacteroidales bacterium]|nr:S49 family peptidase [Bacteroidales bacterium]
MNQNYAYPTEQHESGAKKFWRIVLGSMLGVILSGLLCCFLSLISIISIAVSTDTSPVIKDNSILKLSLSAPVSERATSSPFDDFEIEGLSNPQTGLDDILKCIKNAATDPKIKGIYIQTAHVQAAPATVQEIRDALLEFKESGKFIYAYSDVFANNGYYLATVADKIALNPLGSLDFKGMAGQVLFYKGLLDKLDVEIQVIRHGSFKSAVEPYILDKMSEANRLQMSTLFNSIWDTELAHIEKSRHISKDSLNYFADNLLCNKAENVLQHGLVDQLSYYADVEKELKTMTGIGENEDLRFISISDYKKSVVPLKTSTNKIAVVYAVGEIIDGKGND